MEITSISNGVIIDHLKAGSGLKVLEHLNINTNADSVALIMNAKSEKHGKKDIIKLQNVDNIDLNVLGLINHTATIIYIENDEIVKKIHVELPITVTNVLKCRNPRCVTSIESVPHVFHLADNTGRYRCEYCDNILKGNEY